MNFNNQEQDEYDKEFYLLLLGKEYLISIYSIERIKKSKPNF